MNAAGDKIYFTSQAIDEVDEDIYMLELPAILKPAPVMLTTGHVIDSKTNKHLPDVNIVFENLATGQEVGFASSTPDSGSFQIILPSGIRYGYLAQKKGYISVHSHIDLTSLSAYKHNHEDIYLTPIEVGQTVVIHNVFFDTGKDVLNKESFLELNRLSGLLKTGEIQQIEISGNTDNTGSEAFNDKLSIKRAQSVVSYLLRKSGAKKDRIIMKHNGELKPVASNATAKGRELNRRVQFKILAK